MCSHAHLFLFFSFFFFNDTATSEIYTLSLHDALPIFEQMVPNFIQNGSWNIRRDNSWWIVSVIAIRSARTCPRDRKSTRLNSSHLGISYAVFCLKKKKKNQIKYHTTM